VEVIAIIFESTFALSLLPYPSPSGCIAKASKKLFI